MKRSKEPAVKPEPQPLPPDADKLNGVRAKWAAKALEAHCKARGARVGFWFEDISNLLCNLRHLADRQCCVWRDVETKAFVDYGKDTRAALVREKVKVRAKKK